MYSLRRDTESICKAAGMLDISEFELFELAAKAWYGRELPNKRIEKVFSIYLLKGRIPYWARDFARKVNDRCRSGICDPTAFGVKKPDMDPRIRDLGKWYLVLLIVILAALLYLSLMTIPTF